MPEPQLTERDEDSESEDLEEEKAEQPIEEPVAVDPEDIETIELDDSDLIDGGFFTGTESGQEDGFDPDFDSREQPATEEGIGKKADKALGLDDETSNVETFINEGAARLAVVGLDREYKLDKDEEIAESECLEAEFYEVFETFRLGHFGAGFLDTYIFVDDEPVDPAWGLLGAVLCGCAFTIWMRPDGDEIIDDAKDALSEIGGTN